MSVNKLSRGIYYLKITFPPLKSIFLHKKEKLFRIFLGGLIDSQRYSLKIYLKGKIGTFFNLKNLLIKKLLVEPEVDIRKSLIITKPQLK